MLNEIIMSFNELFNLLWKIIYENWSWGGAIAIMSLWYASKSYGKSREANRFSEESLKLTARSTEISESSLIAAKQAIDTSIDLYKQQKKDAETEKTINEKRVKRALKENIKHIIFYLTPIADNLTDLINSDEVLKEYKYFEVDSNIYIYSENVMFTINSFESTLSMLNMIIIEAAVIDGSVHAEISKMIIALSHFQRTTIPSIKQCLAKYVSFEDIKTALNGEKNVWDEMVASIKTLVLFANSPD